MNSNETQIIEGNATLVLNDNMPSIKSLKSSLEITSQSKKVSNYCLCLNTQNQTTNILDGPVSFLLPPFLLLALAADSLAAASITSEATATEATPAPTGSFFFAIFQNTSENTNHGQHNQQQP